MTRVYSYADAIALDAEAEALYGPRFQGAEHNGDYTHLVPVAQFWRDLDRDAGMASERAVDACEGCVARELRGWPMPDQARLFQ